MPDIEIKCIEPGCEEVRIFSEKDQRYYAERGFVQPKRCKTHSEARKKKWEARENSPFKETFDAMREDPHTRHGRKGDGAEFNT